MSALAQAIARLIENGMDPAEAARVAASLADLLVGDPAARSKALRAERNRRHYAAKKADESKTLKTPERLNKTPERLKRLTPEAAPLAPSLPSPPNPPTPPTPTPRTRGGLTTRTRGGPVGYSVAFETLWASYPIKVGKGAAAKAWDAAEARLAARGDPDPLQTVLQVVQCYRLTDQWRRDGGAFVPHLSTFLNQNRFDDEPTTQGANNGRATSREDRRSTWSDVLAEQEHASDAQRVGYLPAPDGPDDPF